MPKRSSSFALGLISRFLPLVFIILGPFTFQSCYNDPQFLGNNMLPDDDIYTVRRDTSFKISAYTMLQDSISTFGATAGVIGYYNSEVFGLLKSSFVGRYLPVASTAGYGGSTATPDSLFFNFEPSGYQGDTTTILKLSFYRLTDTTLLYSKPNALLPIDGHYEPTPLFTVLYSGTQKLRIPVSLDFARELMDSLALTDNKLFYAKYKGLYITCEPGSTPIKADPAEYGGVLYSLKPSLQFFSLYYHYDTVIDGKDTTIKAAKTFTFTYGSRYFQHLHDRSTAKPDMAMRGAGNTSTQDTVFYIQNLGGAYGMLKLDDFKAWKDSMPVIIHKARLVIAREQPAYTKPDSITNQLLFYYKHNDEWVGVINDQISSGKLNKNGTYRLYSDSYSVDITWFMQNVLEGEIDDPNLYIFPGKDFLLSSAVLGTNNHSRKIKVEIVYSKLK